MNVERVEQLTQEQIAELHALYQREWWTQGRTLDEVQRIVTHSDVIVAFCQPESRQLLAFTRVLTDFVFKAFVFDVIVREGNRDLNLGRLLMDTVLEHPGLKDVKHFELYCAPEMLPFYHKWGFTERLGELQFMRLDSTKTT